MQRLRELAIRRLLAFFVDWLVIAAWGGALFGAVVLINAGIPSRPSSPWLSQAIGFVAMTLPVLLYFALTESASAQATLGKRALHLHVVRSDGEQLQLSTSLLRSAVKFAPWELGHTVANQAVYAGASGVPDWVYLPMALSLALPAWWAVSMFRGGATPYDALTSTKVVSTTL